MIWVTQSCRKRMIFFSVTSLIKNPHKLRMRDRENDKERLSLLFFIKKNLAMNVFKTCFSPKRSDIYLPEDEEEDENVNKMCCCFNFKGNNKQGFIQLPTNNNNSRRRTIDDYLDPRSPVSIEVLLQEQEEELDHYYGQTDDEDAYHGPQKKFGPLDLNFENTNSSFFEEEDAQFLSEHRISAILVDRPKVCFWFIA